MLWVFVLCAALGLLILAYRLAISRAKKAVVEHFWEGSYLHERDHLSLSFDVRLENDFLCLCVDQLNVFISPFSKKRRLLEVSVKSLSLELKTKPPLHANQRRQSSLKLTVVQYVACYIVFLILKSLRVTIGCFHLQIKGFEFTINGMMLTFERHASDVKANLMIKDTYLSEENPLVFLSGIDITLCLSLGSRNSLRTILFTDFEYECSQISLEFNENAFQLNGISVTGCIRSAFESQFSLDIKPIQLIVPTFDLHTKQLTLTFERLSYKDRILEVEYLEVTRNYFRLLEIPTLKFRDFSISATSLQVYVPFTLLIDISLIAHKIQEVSRKPKKTYPNLEPFRPLRAKIESVTLFLLFSDTHILSFELNRFAFGDLTAGCRTLFARIHRDSQVYELGEGYRLRCAINPPLLDIKVMKLDVVIPIQLNFTTYMQELTGILRYLQKALRGDIRDIEDTMPPTKMIFEVSVTEGRIEIPRFEMTNEIERIVEAKRGAMEAHTTRLSKAYLILQNQNIESINNGALEHAKSKLLFDLFRRKLKEIPEEKKPLMSFEAKNLYFKLDGPAVGDRQGALNLIKDFVPETETIGHLTGGVYNCSCEMINYSQTHLVDFLRADGVNGKGVFFNSRYNGTKKSDFYFNRITCDNGETSFDIPQVAARSVAIISAKADIDKFLYRFSPLVQEQKHDGRITTRYMRKQPHEYKWIQFFDVCRIRMRLDLDANVHYLKCALHHPSNVYDQHSSVDAIAIDTRVSLTHDVFYLRGGTAYIEYFTSHGMTRLISIPFVNTKLYFVSMNPHRTKPKPLFVMVDSTRLYDSDYDPFYEVRTHTFNLFIENLIEEGAVTIEVDNLQALLDDWLTKRPAMATFIKPPDFSLRPKPFPMIDETHVNTKLQDIKLSMNHGLTIVRLQGNPFNIDVDVSLTKGISTAVGTDIMTISMTHRMVPLANFTVQQFLYALKNKENLITIGSLRIDITCSIFKEFPPIPLKFPSSKTSTSVDDYQSRTEAMTGFDTRMMKTTISKIFVNLDIEEQGCFELDVSTLNAAMMKNPTAAIALDFDVSSVKLSHLTHNLLGINRVSVATVFATNRMLLYVFVAEIALRFRSAEIDLAKQIAKMIPPLSSGPKTHKPKKQAMRIFAELRTFSLILLENDWKDLLVSTVMELRAQLIRQEDLSEMYHFYVQTISADLVKIEDKFREIVRTPHSDSDIITVSIAKTKPLMRCPVFDTIDVKLAPIIIHYPVQLWGSLSGFFSADDNQDFDIEESLAVEAASPSPDETVEEVIVEEGGSVIFCRSICIQPFNALLNIRRNNDGAFSEFLDRNLVYDGLELTDLCGTKEQITSLVKKKLRWAIVKAVAVFLFTKQRHIEQRT